MADSITDWIANTIRTHDAKYKGKLSEVQAGYLRVQVVQASRDVGFAAV